MMNKQLLTASALSCLVGLGAAVEAGAAGFASTDRFGYDGTIVRYNSESDARSGSNAVDTISVTDRDMAIRVSDGMNIIYGSWYYSTAVDGNGAPKGMGSGNTTGNTGVGFMQIFDNDGSTDTSVEMSFDGFDGTNYTEFSLSLEGENALRGPSGDYGRLSAYDNTNDGGDWLEYQLNFTATGLEGQDDGSNFVSSNNQPTGVTGSFTGLFENLTDSTNQGFYVADFTLNMDNWAWENRDDLVAPEGGFADSTFAVPSPTAAFGGLVMLGGLAMRRRRRA